MTFKEWMINFIKESNTIENIHRGPTSEEIEEAWRFIELEDIDIGEIIRFVSVYQPNAVLRDKKGLNVMVGNHLPPKGGPEIKKMLEDFLDCINGDPISDYTKNPFLAHKEYEALHPFTDCNGRSGRIIWLWLMRKLNKKFAPMGFLQTWYYQSLDSKCSKI